MARIFICYSRHNQEVVKTLNQDLEALGHSTWYDQELSGGQLWWDQILEQIRSCDVFIFSLSPQALESHACKQEYTYAAQLGKTLLPVLVDEGVSLNLLPPALSTIQHIDYRQQDKITVFNLIKALNNLPTPGPLPEPLPDPPGVPLSYLGEMKEQIETNRILSFQEQAALVFKLKERLPNSEYPEETINLMLSLRKRDDLLARIASEIDCILAEHKKTEQKASVESGFEFAASSGTAQQRPPGDLKQEAPPKPQEPPPEPKPVPSPPSRTRKILHKVALAFVLVLHFILAGLVSGLISEIPRWSSNKYGSYYYSDDEMVTAALIVFTLALALLLFIRRKVKKALAGQLRRGGFLDKLFDNPANHKITKWILNLSLFVFLLFPLIALINTLDRLGGF